MTPRFLVLACAMSVGCFSQPPVGTSMADYPGWTTPEVLVKHQPEATAVKAVVAEPEAQKVATKRAPVQKKAPKVAYAQGQAAGLGNDIDLGGALKSAQGAAETTTRRATTRRTAVEAPKLEQQAKAGAVSLAPTSGQTGTGSASLSIGGTSLRRGLSADQIRDVALASMGQVRACYERALKADPALRGRIVVDWKVAPSGDVSRAAIGSDDIGSAELQTCIIDTIKTWTFPEAGKSTPVSFPFTLKPG